MILQQFALPERIDDPGREDGGYEVDEFHSVDGIVSLDIRLRQLDVILVGTEDEFDLPSLRIAEIGFADAHVEVRFERDRAHRILLLEVFFRIEILVLDGTPDIVMCLLAHGRHIQERIEEIPVLQFRLLGQDLPLDAFDDTLKGVHVIVRYGLLVPPQRSQEMEVLPLLEDGGNFLWRKALVSDDNSRFYRILHDELVVGNGIDVVAGEDG